MADDDKELSERSVADLLKQASDQAASLIRQKPDLAKAELEVKARRWVWGRPLIRSRAWLRVSARVAV